MLYYKMEDKLLDGIKHIKEISKQKVTFDRIISYLKKNKEQLITIKLSKFLINVLTKTEQRYVANYILFQQLQIVPKTQLTDEVEEENNTFVTTLVEKAVHSDTTQKDEMLQSTLDELKKFRSFQDSVENKLY